MPRRFPHHRGYRGGGYGGDGVGRPPEYIRKAGPLGCCTIFLIIIGSLFIFFGAVLFIISHVSQPEPYEKPKPGSAFDKPFFADSNARQEKRYHEKEALSRRLGIAGPVLLGIGAALVISAILLCINLYKKHHNSGSGHADTSVETGTSTTTVGLVSGPTTVPPPENVQMGGPTTSPAYPHGSYPPPQNQYPAPQGPYPPPQGQYPRPQGQYPPPQGQYPPPQGQYPPPHGQYPPPQGQYPQPQGQYPGGQFPPPQGAYNLSGHQPSAPPLQDNEGRPPPAYHELECNEEKQPLKS